MTKEIKYIEKVEIKGLWNKFDIEWNLNKDVNILAGGNGSGKSTILIAIYDLLVQPKKIMFNIERIKIISNNKKEPLFFQHVIIGKEDMAKLETIELVSKIRKEKFVTNGIEHNGSEIEKMLKEVFLQEEDARFILSSMPEINDLNSFTKNIHIDFISTFNTELKSSEEIKKLSNDEVKTELDWEIYKLQTQYKDYQLNIGKRKDAILEISKNPKKEITKIRKPQNDFLDILDECFAETNKKINKEKNEISFLIDATEITAYQLSSGEKQLLIILLKTLIQDNRQSILFLDEPEISLHIDWQRQLIGFIRQLNPNVQIIMATHSPAMIMNGWLDKVFNVSDLIVPKSKLS